MQLNLLTDSAVNVVINDMKKKTPHFSNKKFLPIELNPLKLMIQPRQSLKLLSIEYAYIQRARKSKLSDKTPLIYHTWLSLGKKGTESTLKSQTRKLSAFYPIRLAPHRVIVLAIRLR